MLYFFEVRLSYLVRIVEICFLEVIFFVINILLVEKDNLNWMKENGCILGVVFCLILRICVNGNGF